MRLSPEQVAHFYAVWQPLLLYVNQKLRVEPSMLDARTDEPWDVQKVYPIREALWANDHLREAYIAENPAGLSPADLAIVGSWRHRVAGTFCIYRHLKRHSILIKDGPDEVYGVLGLASGLDELTPFTPCYVKTVLLPFEGRIIYDSFVVAYNVYLGPGIRRSLADTYKDAKECGAIHTSLPPEGPASREEGQAKAHAVDARVMEAFRQHLYQAGLSTRVVERDIATASAFAEHLAAGAEPRSLRDLDSRAPAGYLDTLRSEGSMEAQHRQARTSLNRLLRFLRDTGRMDPDSAHDALELLKG
jgi:hypothetical protein